MYLIFLIFLEYDSVGVPENCFCFPSPEYEKVTPEKIRGMFIENKWHTLSFF